MKTIFRISFILCFLVIIFSFTKHFLFEIFISKTIIIPYGLKEFNICETHPIAWQYIKFFYIVFLLLSSIIISNTIFSHLFKNFRFSKKVSNINKENLVFTIGNNLVYEKELYQNFLITGSIGSGKTSSAMYPFCKTLISYNSYIPNQKIGMLILDVKGNFYIEVKQFSELFGREDDLIIIELNGTVKYNPLHKPHLKASVLSNRLKTILTLFSANNSDSYWLDKAEQVLCEAIKLCRMYNNGYVTFEELHKIILYPNYIDEKLSLLKKDFQSGKLSENDIFNLLSIINFFTNEINNLDSRVLSILKSEISRITNIFITDKDIYDTFCPDINSLTFSNFDEVIQKGKIVVLNMNISKYDLLSKIIATYLKLDFQTEVLSNISNNQTKTCAFICDEYHEYVTTTDANFFAQSREAKCINIVATQSYSSILNTLKDQNATKVIIQNLINKLWFRNDDIFTIEEAQKQIGKKDILKTSKNISENNNSIKYNHFLNNFISNNSSFSESISTYYQNEYIYDTSFFTQKLETFSCLAFLINPDSTLTIEKVKMIPYFKEVL